MSRILADGVMAMLRSASVQRIRLVLGGRRMAEKLRKTYHRGSEDADRLGLIFASALPDFCTSALFYTQSFEKNMDNEGQ